jgi:chaperonin GroES
MLEIEPVPFSFALKCVLHCNDDITNNCLSVMATSTSQHPDIQPLRDRVFLKLIEEDEGERETEAGIIIPETATENDEQVQRGEVIAVGDGDIRDGERVPVAVDEDDTVLFSWGNELEFDGEEYYIVNESNILAVVN